MRVNTLTQWRRGTNRWLCGVMMLLICGCSLRQTAVNAIGDALVDGGSVYASENDPELIREALPFGLKTFESLLEVSPRHQGLLLATAQGFAAYAFFLQMEADRLDSTNPDRSRELRGRIRNLYLRSREYSLRGLEIRHPGFTQQLHQDRTLSLRTMTKDDAPFLYWAGASLAGAISTATNDLALLVDLPLAGALVQRVLEIDEQFDHGTAHEFFISYEASRPGGSMQRAREHYRRALAISGGQRASVYLALAEAVAVKAQNPSEFRALLSAALSVDPEQNPQLRLVNTLARQRALWLQSRIDHLFLDVETRKENPG